MSPEETNQLRAETEQLRSEVKKKRANAMDTNLFKWAQENSLKPLSGVRALNVRRTLKGHDGKIYDMHWASDSLHVLSAAQDGKMILWETTSMNKLAAVNMSSSWVMCCDISSDSVLAASGGLDNICTVHRISNGEKVVELNGHTGFLSSCRFHKGNQVLTTSGDSRILLWDMDRAVPIREFVGHNNDVASMDIISPDNEIFATGGCDMTARIWDVRSGRPERVFHGHSGDVSAISFFPDGNAIATGSEDCTSRLFDLRADNEIACYSNPNMENGVTSVSFSSSGMFLFVAYENGDYCQWDTMRGERISIQSSAHDGKISRLEVAPDGSAICTASWDGLLKIWV